MWWIWWRMLYGMQIRLHRMQSFGRRPTINGKCLQWGNLPNHYHNKPRRLNKELPRQLQRRNMQHMHTATLHRSLRIHYVQPLLFRINTVHIRNMLFRKLQLYSTILRIGMPGWPMHPRSLFRSYLPCNHEDLQWWKHPQMLQQLRLWRLWKLWSRRLHNNTRNWETRYHWTSR